MNSLSFIFVGILATVTKASGVGKAWEIAPIQSSDDPRVFGSWPHLKSSAFKVLSVSGVGRFGSSTEKSSREATSTEESVERVSSSLDRAEDGGEEMLTQRVAKELDDLGSEEDFVPEIEFQEPTIEAFLRRSICTRARSKESGEVEAFPRIWQKIEQIGKTARKNKNRFEVEEFDGEPSEEFSEVGEKIGMRIRRETESGMEKIAGSKSMREARVNSPDSWSKQPLSVKFYHRTKLEDEAAENENKSAKPRGIEAPNVDFVTSNRRSFTEGRESREMSMPVTSRSYGEIPIYRNSPRDLDVPYSRNEAPFYPERYRTERDFFVRSGMNEPIYEPGHYREYNFDRRGRNKPTPKPKRIIYYATLPEIVRKPVDLRNYPRPYDSLMRSTANANNPYWKRRSGANDPMRYRYYSYLHGNYDNDDYFDKNRAWIDRPYFSYTERIEDSRRREYDLDHASIKESSRNEEALGVEYDQKISKLRGSEKVPWPVQIGTEVNVKDNDRVTGRQVFGPQDDYVKFRNGGRFGEQYQSGSVKNGN